MNRAGEAVAAIEFLTRIVIDSILIEGVGGCVAMLFVDMGSCKDL